MAGRRRLGRPRSTIVILTLISITLITLDFRGGSGPLDSVRSLAADLLSPARDAGEALVSPLGSAWRGVVGYDELEAENAELRAELARREADTLLVAEQRRELDELRSALGLVDRLDGTARLVARVRRGAVTNFDRTIELDVGSDDGVMVGAPVVAPDGLVGRVIEVAGSSARVQLSIDPSFQVGVRLSWSGETGVARGGGSRQPLDVDFLDIDTVVVPGETVTTSGLDGSAYPAGLLVGTLISAERDEINRQLVAEMAPAVDFNRLDSVVVLLSVPVDSPPEGVR